MFRTLHSIRNILFLQERKIISGEQLYILVVPGDVNNFSVKETSPFIFEVNSCLTTNFLRSRSMPTILAFFCMSNLHIIKIKLLIYASVYN